MAYSSEGHIYTSGGLNIDYINVQTGFESHRITIVYEIK